MRFIWIDCLLRYRKKVKIYLFGPKRQIRSIWRTGYIVRRRGKPLTIYLIYLLCGVSGTSYDVKVVGRNS